MAKKTKKIRKKINSPDKVLANPQTTTVWDYFGPYLGRRKPLLGQLLGIEVEVETSNDQYPNAGRMNADSKFWNSIADNSLRNAAETGGGGREYVFKNPVKFGQVEEALMELEKYLTDSASKIRWSNRTSVHVHLNVQDLTLSQLICLLSLYYIVEPILSRYNGFDRENNLFCMQAVNSRTVIDNLMDFLRTKRFPDNTKYSALNTMNLQRGLLGTLEFRAGAGIDSTPLEVLPWVNLLWTVVEASKTFKEPSDILSQVSNEGCVEFVQRVLPEVYAEGLASFERRELQMALMSAMRVSQCVAFEIDWGEYEVAVPDEKTGAENLADIIRHDNNTRFEFEIPRGDRVQWHTRPPQREDGLLGGYEPAAHQLRRYVLGDAQANLRALNRVVVGDDIQDDIRAQNLPPVPIATLDEAEEYFEELAEIGED